MSGKVEAVWLKTTVNYTRDELRCNQREDICEMVPVPYESSFTSLKVEDSQSEWRLAVEAHLKHVRKFTNAKTGFGGALRHINGVRTEVCASVDNGKKFAGIFPVNDTECQPLTEGNVIPEEETVANLFRSAQATVALLGPVRSETAMATSKTSENAVKSGTQAVPGSSAPVPEKAPVSESQPLSIPWEIEP